MKKAIKAKGASKKVVSLVAALTLLTTGGISSFAASAAMGEKANLASGGKFYTDYNTHAEALEAARELNKQIAEEGNVLLKNDGTLPMSTRNYVSVFGRADDALIGGYGSVSDSLIEAGFRVNPALKDFYDKDEFKSSSTGGAGFATGGGNIGTEPLTFGAKVENTFSLYKDAAVIVLSRNGGEGSDPARVTTEVNDDSKNIDGWEHRNLANNGKEGAEYKEYKHYLQLTDSENELIDYVKARFNKIVVVLNTSNVMEMYNLQNDPRINGILLMERPGATGVSSVGKILSGEVNPSGRSSDEWYRDFSADPSWMNFGNNGQVGSTNTFSLNEVSDVTKTGITGVSYEEGIYTGYKFYETVYAEIKEGRLGVKDGLLVDKNESGAQTGADAATAWWEANVVYSFGHGLSYTTFDMAMGDIYTDKNLTAANKLGAEVEATQFNNSKGAKAEVDKLFVPVTVENTGKVAGKQVVQLYVTAPYTPGEVEKSFVKLVGFAKTDLLQPGAKQTVVVEFDVQDMASFDYTDANGNDNTGYELDAGTYEVKIMEDAHKEVNKKSFELKDDAFLKADDFSLNEVKVTDFSNPESEYYTIYDPAMFGGDKFGGEKMTILSRNDFAGTMPDGHKASDYIIKKAGLDYLQNTLNVDADKGIDVAGARWLLTDEQKSEMTDWTQATAKNDKGEVDGTTGATKKETVDDRTNGLCKILLRDMAGIPFTGTFKYQNTDANGKYYTTIADFNGKTPDQCWEIFMNQLTFNEIWRIITQCSQSTPAVPSIGKQASRNIDGPNSTADMSWCDETTVGSTWNTDLAYKQGVMVGNLYTLKGYTSWYAPAVNSHRSPFGGRCNEYYSSDALHSGFMAAAAASGCESRGVNCYIKHFTVNDQETNRTNVCTFVDEQNLRENYLPSFQKPLQEGGASCLMMTFSRVGIVSGPSNYVLLNDILRGEWGWNGVIGTDFFPYRDSAFTVGIASFDVTKSYAVGDQVLNGTSIVKFTKAFTGVTADTFVQANSYAVGDKVVYNGKYYEFTKAHSGRWATKDVKEIVLLFTVGANKNVEEFLTPTAAAAASTFDVKKAYKVNDLVKYNDKYYVFTAAHAAGEWNAEHVKEFTVATVGDNYYHYAGGQSTNVDFMIRNGGVHPLGNDNTCSGQWDETLRDKKGGVTLNTGANGKAEQSDIQYYYMRLQATRILYCYANSVNIDNGVLFGENYTLRYDYVDSSRNPQPAIKTKEIADAKVGVALNVNLAATQNEMGKGNVATYSIGKGALPAGLTLNPKTGVLAGNPTEAGEFKFTVFATILNNHGELDVTLKVADSLIVDGETTVKLGEELDIYATYAKDTISSDYYDKGMEFSATGLPEGVSIDKTGVISGTPAKAGEYEITVTLKATHGTGANAVNDVYNWNFTVTVQEDVFDVEGAIAEITAKLEALEKGLEANDLTQIKADIAALKAVEPVDVSALEARIKALEEKSAEEGGCNSSVSIVSASLVLVPVLALGAAAVLAKKKSKKD